MAPGVTRRCILLVADEHQLDQYCDFKAEIEETSNGVVEIEDLEDVHSAEGEEISEKLLRFLQIRDVIIIVCSEQMKTCIEDKRNTTMNIDGTSVALNGQKLDAALQEKNIRSKVILISWNADDKHIPTHLVDIPNQVHSDSITKAFVNQVIYTIRGIRT